MYAGASWMDIAGRLLIVAFFVLVGIGNLKPARIDDHINRARLFKAPFPVFVFWFGLALEFASCALLLADWHADLGVLGLIVFTVFATAIYLRFWQVQDPFKYNVMRLGFLSNIGLLGGLVLLLQSVR